MTAFAWRTPFVALSLGWGIQSFTLAAMVALGELPPIDVAIHADTTHERKETYDFAARWTPWLEERGVKVATVEDTPKGQVDQWGGLYIPAFTIGNEPDVEMILDEDDEVIEWRLTGTSSRVNGQLRRQCTQRWKIAPIRRYLQANRNGAPVEQWIGISTDEALRMKPSDAKYIAHRWPLIEKCMSRNDCIAWLRSHNLEVPKKSSCVFCPYHDSSSWRELKMSGNGDWQKAVEVDRAIRKARPPYDLFIHPSHKSLETVDLRNDEDRGQLRLWDEECSGLCGV